MAKGKLTVDSILSNKVLSVDDYNEEDFTAKAPVQKKAIQKKVPISELLPNEKNDFFTEKDDQYLELVEVIKRDGLSNPIRVKEKDSNGKYTILSGHRRWQACLDAGIEQVAIVIYPEDLDASDEIAYMTRENGGGRKADPFGKAMMLKQYMDAQSKLPQSERKDPQTELKISHTNFFQIKKLAVLDKDILTIGQKGLLSRDMGISLANMKDDHKITYKAKVEEIKEIFASAISDQEKAAKIKATLTPEKKKTSKKSEKIDGYKEYKKAFKQISQVANPNFVLPEDKKKKEELKKLCLEMQKSINSVLEKL